jgi:DNA modification methylase
LCLIPTSYAWALAYGHSPFDPDDRIDPWRIRNVVVWHRPNPPVGALGDKVRPSTSYVTVACMRRDRWFDLDAERTEHSELNHTQVGKRRSLNGGDVDRLDGDGRSSQNPAGAPPLDHWTLPEDDPPQHESWTIPTQPYAGSHYATFPIALPRRLIRLMCPMHVCQECGLPRRRITEKSEDYDTARSAVVDLGVDRDPARRSVNIGSRAGHLGAITCAENVTLGWSDCGHNNYRRGRVLDPFAGSGTTLAAATEQGRDATGIDIDEDNYWLARQRIGLFLEEPA